MHGLPGSMRDGWQVCVEHEAYGSYKSNMPYSALIYGWGGFVFTELMHA